MTEYRRVRPEEWEDCIELANYVFSIEHCPHDFEQMIPKVYQAGNQMAQIHRAAVEEDGRLRAEIAVLPQEIYAGGKKLSAGYVGSVSVHPKARGKGYMKHLLHDWIEELEETCDLLMLDGQRQRYAYFGFTPGSIQLEFVLDPANIRHALGFLNAKEYSFEEMFFAHPEEDARFAVLLNEKKPAYTVRKKEKVEACLKTFGEKTYLIRKKEEKIGYLTVCQKDKITEAEMIKEEEYLPALAAFLVQNSLDGMKIEVPAYEVQKIRALRTVCETCTTGRCGSAMYRIHHFAEVIEAYLQLKADTGRLQNGKFSAVMEGQPVMVTVQDGKVTVKKEASEDAPVLTREQAQELLLSQTLEMSGYAGIPPEIAETIPSNWFPLPLYCYMADEF